MTNLKRRAIRGVFLMISGVLVCVTLFSASPARSVAVALITAATATAEPIAVIGTLTLITKGFGAPDDLALGADGTLYFGDLGVNRVAAIALDGTVSLISPTIKEPEGLVALADGTLIVAEQASNKLLRLDPIAQTVTLFYAVGNRTANPGIDNIAYDPVTDDFLIPDAPMGRILRLRLDGTHLKVMATGFWRPTAVALGADGTLYVCDEYRQTIERITSDGKRSKVAAIASPDDVIIDTDGSLLVNSLRGTIWRLDPTSGATTALVTGLIEPHGIILDKDGNVIIADAKRNAIYRLTRAQVAPTPSATS